MFELPEELKKKYKYIELATPKYEDYKKYVEGTCIDTPATKDQFIDVASFIASDVISDRLDLSEKEKKLILTYLLHNRLLKVFDCLIN